jgi:Dolichyl-phosphate-mannose-protein mannosyltransferase
VKPVKSGMAIVLALAGAKLLAHLLLASNYGIFRDELYFLACSEHLDWGYVDQPPLIAGIAWLARHAFGESLPGLRLLPALAGAGKVVLAGLLARSLGGGRYAQGLAALAVVVAPIYLGVDHILTMNAFEPLFWMGGALCVIRWIQTGNDRLWIGFGVLMGLGLLNKQTTLVFGLSVVAGLLATPARRAFAKAGIWIGGAVALVLFLPNFLWMAQRHFPMLELLANIKRNQRNVSLNPVEFVSQQGLFLLPLTAPIWIAGLLWLTFAREGRPYRCFAIAWVVFEVALIVTDGRVYYAAPIFPLYLAAGGVALEQWLSGRGKAAALVQPAYACVVALGGIAFAPMFLPVLSEEGYVHYAERLGIRQPRLENHEMGPLPQFYADMHGWREIAEATAGVYRSLPAEDRAKAAIFGNNYGEAGAIDFFGPALGLPKAIGAHQSYFYWGPRDATGEVLIVLGEGDRAALESKCRSVELATTLHDRYAMPYENKPIYVCRGIALSELWPKLKKWG